MRATLTLVAVLLAMGARGEIAWRDGASLTIEGQGWTATEARYDRLPAKAKGVAPASVWGLSRHAAGLAIRFTTDASEVHVRWSLTGEGLAMPHMPATGVSGVDLYERSATGRWRFIANGRPASKDGNAARFALNGDGAHDLRLYLPLYNGVRKVEVGVPEGRSLLPGPTADPRRRVVYYGTSIAQGGCASRPGTAHVAILGRMLDREMVNLGFSGSGRMEPAVASLIAELDASAYVLDCLWNMGGLKDDEIVARVMGLARAVRSAHPSAPMVFVGQSHMDPRAHPTRLSRLQESAVARLRREGMKGLHLVRGDDLIGPDGEGTVDGCHPTDLGMMRQAEALAPVLKRVLR